jgi:outer membrane protein assembly factor BamB
VTCVDLNTGKELWKQTAYEGAPKTAKHANSTYSCETPVTDGERLYAYFGMHGLFCYDLDGTLLWKKEFGTYWTQNGWGTGSSPALYNNTVYIQNDNDENSFLIALDAITGLEKWKVQRDEKTSYTTPYIWKNKQRTEVVTTAKTARSYDPETGALLWEMKLGGENAVPSPVGDKNLIYLGNPGNMVKGFLYAVKAGASGDITPAEGQLTTEWIAWTYTKTSLGNPSSLLYNGRIYNIGSRGGMLFCLDALTGEEIFNGRVPGIGAVWASPWGYNGKVWYFDENGVTATLQAGDSLQYTTDNKLADKFWASVAISGDKYIFKGVKKLYCVKL